MLRKMPENGDVKDHLNDLFDAIGKLQSMNVEINGDMLAIIILYSLPDTYDTFRCATESRVKIIEESEARKNKLLDTSNAQLVKQQNKFHIFKNKTEKENKNASSSTNKRTRCNYCRKIRHKASNCYAKKDSDQKASQAIKTALLTEDKNKLIGCA